MKKITTPEERVAFLRKSLELSQIEFAESLDITQGALSQIENGKSRLSLYVLNRICDTYKISADWMIYGEKPMYRKNILQKAMATPSSNKKSEKSDLIYFIDRKAQADYLNNYHDIEYIRSLEAYRIPGFKDGNYRMFEVSGNSMEPALFDDEILVVELVEGCKHIVNGNIFVLLTKEGIVVKRVYVHDAEFKYLVLKSDNPKYDPYKIKSEEVVEIWEVKAKITTGFLKITTGEDGMNIFEKYKDLESRIKNIEKALLENSGSGNDQE